MTHEKEIRYWASHPDGTKVWVKLPLENGVWQERTTLAWDSKNLYITSDEWADLRKANADGVAIQVWDGDVWVDLPPYWWKYEFYHAVKAGFTPDRFRIKPKPWYEQIPPKGILCRVWTKNDKVKKIRVVKEYKTDGNARFVAVPNGLQEGYAEILWHYAEPLRPDDPLIWEGDDDVQA